MGIIHADSLVIGKLKFSIGDDDFVIRNWTDKRRFSDGTSVVSDEHLTKDEAKRLVEWLHLHFVKDK